MFANFCFIMIARSDIVGTKSNIALNSWLSLRVSMSVDMVGSVPRGQVFDASSRTGWESITLKTKINNYFPVFVVK